MSAKQDLPIILFSSPAAWERWLADQHATSDGVLLKLAKKGSGIDSISYAEAVEVALCYGWIDGQASKFDEDHWLQRFTPRRSRSKWSRINRDKATDLIERGEMKPAGLREIERAKADGRWPLGRGLRGTEHGNDSRRPPASARRQRAGPRLLLHPRQPEPVRHPVPNPRGQEARNPRTTHRQVRRDAQRAEEGLPIASGTLQPPSPVGAADGLPALMVNVAMTPPAHQDQIVQISRS